MDTYGPVWTSMVSYGPVCSRMDMYGPVWSLFVLYGPIWSYMVLHGPIWSRMVLFCLLRSRLVLYGLQRSHIALYCSVWSCLIFKWKGGESHFRKNKQGILSVINFEIFIIPTSDCFKTYQLCTKSMMLDEIEEKYIFLKNKCNSQSSSCICCGIFAWTFFYIVS